MRLQDCQILRNWYFASPCQLKIAITPFILKIQDFSFAHKLDLVRGEKMPQRRDSVGAICKSIMGMCVCFFCVEGDRQKENGWKGGPTFLFHFILFSFLFFFKFIYIKTNFGWASKYFYIITLVLVWLSSAMCAVSMNSHLCMKMSSFLFVRAWAMPRILCLSCGVPFPVWTPGNISGLISFVPWLPRGERS